jgi:hypothetical protein
MELRKRGPLDTLPENKNLADIKCRTFFLNQNPSFLREDASCQEQM